MSPVALNAAIERNIADGIPLARQTLIMPGQYAKDGYIITCHGNLKIRTSSYINDPYLIRDDAFVLGGVKITEPA